MIKRSISDDIWLSVIGLDAGGVLAAADPEALLDAAMAAGITWLDVAAGADYAVLAALLTKRATLPQLVLAATDVSQLDACPLSLTAIRLPVPAAAALPVLQSVAYSLFDDQPRESGMLDECFAAGIGAISDCPLAGLDAPPADIERSAWDTVMAEMNALAEDQETDRHGLAIAILQATPGMLACVLRAETSEAVLALADYGMPAKTAAIKKMSGLLWSARNEPSQPKP
jgi:hypothetical protein